MDIFRGQARQGQPRGQVRLVKRLKSFVNKLLRVLHLRVRAVSNIEAVRIILRRTREGNIQMEVDSSVKLKMAVSEKGTSIKGCY